MLSLAGCSEARQEAQNAADEAQQAAGEAAQAVDQAAGEAKQAAGEGMDEVQRAVSGDDALWTFEGELGEPVASFGQEPRWTETTEGAANRGTTGAAHTVVGEVVDVSCYMQLGKRGEAHIPCGTDCVKNGAPIGVVDADNRLYIVMAEEHDPRRYGTVALKEAMVLYMAKTVEVTGMLTERDGVRTLYVLGYAGE